MKKYRTADKNFIVKAYKENGKYILHIGYWTTGLVATKGSRKPHVEEFYNDFTKVFDKKEQANNYFIKVKQSHPTLARYE